MVKGLGLAFGSRANVTESHSLPARIVVWKVLRYLGTASLESSACPWTYARRIDKSLRSSVVHDSGTLVSLRYSVAGSGTRVMLTATPPDVLSLTDKQSSPNNGLLSAYSV